MPLAGMSVRRALRAEDGSARAGEEAGLDEERHHHRSRDRLAVEALDREAFRAAALHVRDERRERDAKPVLLRLAERHERATAALDEEHRLAAEQDDLCAGDPGGARRRCARRAARR